MIDAKEKLVERQMRPLRDRYRANLERLCSALGLYVKEVTVPVLTDTECDDLAALVHRAIGSGAIFGYPEITNTGSDLETLLLVRPRCSHEDLVQRLRLFFDACSAALSP